MKLAQAELQMPSESWTRKLALRVEPALRRQPYQDNVFRIVGLRGCGRAIAKTVDYDISCGFVEDDARKVVSLVRGKIVAVVGVRAIELRPR